MVFRFDGEFHGHFDRTLIYQPGGSSLFSPSYSLAEHKELRYRFYAHFHPYVGELVRRLVEGSVSGLQAADTEYGTPVQLASTAPARRRDQQNTPVTLASGEWITLPDGATITLADGKAAKLSGNRVVRSDNGASVTLPEISRITLPHHTLAKRADGTPVTLDADAPATLPDGKPRPALYEPIFSRARYNPTELVQTPHPVKDLDFSDSGAYAVYNWELFLHVPLIIAVHLSKNQRFEEAQRWFHYVFDPTDDSDGPTPERFWKVKPFQRTDIERIEEILVNLVTGDDPELQRDTIRSIEAWKNAPFRPHLVARHRQPAYMVKTVMAYLDNLIDWGDSLFRQDTGESINEATQLYVLAANILGPRPQAIPAKGSVQPQTYASLRDGLRAFGTVQRALETDMPFNLVPHPGAASDQDRLGTLRSLGSTLYFCVPRNDKLLGYWDTVADRLFKIRNSLNLQGIFRQLPLFEPPIDPALLARAAAAGLDVGAVVSGANQPLPLVRFAFLVQRAAEICQEVKSLGGSLLSAIEKEDNEALALLRARHERVILDLAETVRYAQWQEAIKNREGLEKSLANAAQRYIYYERLLGRSESEITLPELDPLNTEDLARMRLQASEPAVGLRPIGVDIAQSGPGAARSVTSGIVGVADITGGKKINSYESEELNLLEAAQLVQDAAVIADTIGSGLSLIPQFNIHAKPLGVGVSTGFGGVQLSRMFSMIASLGRGVAGRLSYEASRAAKVGAYARREQEWAFQSNLAAGEITQIFKQLRAAQIREAIAKREWENHKKQIEQADEMEYFLSGEVTRRGVSPGANWKKKTTNEAFYAWMKREVRGLYAQCFQFAFDIARKAERALQHELGDPDLRFLQFGYLAGKEGLLAGEKLYFDIKRMEMAYHDLNQREYELTRHVSLLQVAPEALLRLRATGRCTVFLPEEIFDMDCPGHYFRRIKSVAVSIPSVVGPYTSVNCTLTLLKSSIRKTPRLDDGYARDGAEDPRFSDHFGSLQSIVTSTGQNDSGLFETNLRDERYLPFEGSGVISEWQLELPDDVRQFDYDTIADVILHLRYTAREGGVPLRNQAVAHLKERIREAQAAGSVRLFSIRHEFPNEWARFKSVPAGQAARLTLHLRPEHYPFWSRGAPDFVKRVDVFARTGLTDLEISDQPPAESAVVKKDRIDTPLGKLRSGKLTNISLPAPIGELTLYFNNNAMEALWLALTWAMDLDKELRS